MKIIVLLISIVFGIVPTVYSHLEEDKDVVSGKGISYLKSVYATHGESYDRQGHEQIHDPQILSRHPRLICGTGYQNINGRCKPLCWSTCNNGTCQKPYNCTCDVGFKSSFDRRSCVPLCRHNERWNNFTRNCQSACTYQCVNGDCNGPDVCKCRRGFVPLRNNKFVCKPMCSKNCEFGTCTGIETCTCKSGYYLSSNNYTCKPKCQTGCENGKCHLPNVCWCKPGYITSKNKQYCLPFCEGCRNGDCTAPGRCTCKQDYVLNNKTGNCDPHCPFACEHGWCEKPNFCGCYSGWERNQANQCRPAICKEPCMINGKCVRDNVCKCNEGYSEYRDSVVGERKCKPKCKNDCLNGVCNAPDNCICNSGYRYNSRSATCNPVCREPCVNGICVEPDVCKCNRGFVKNATIFAQNVTFNREFECVSRGSKATDTIPAVIFILFGITYIVFAN